MSLNVRTVTEVRIDNDTRADEMRTVEMFSRWRPDAISGGRGTRNHDDRHPGERVLNTLMQRGPVTAAMALRLADWVDAVEAWATAERGHWEAEATRYIADGVTADQPAAIGTLGNPLAAAFVIIVARNECLVDCAEFRETILLPLLSAFGADELEEARLAEVEKAERQAAKAAAV